MLVPVAALLALAGTALATPEADIRVITRTGEAAPGLSGLTFGDVSSPRMNAAGRTAFVAILAGAGVTASNDSSIWVVSGDGSGPVLLLREAEPGPFTDAGVLGGVSLPLLNALGDVALPAANVTGPTPTTVGFMVVESSGLRRSVAFEGIPAPGLSPARNFDGFALQAFSDNGSSAFAANRLAGAPGGLAYAGGVWSDRTGTLTLVAGHGQTAPGFDGSPRTFGYVESPSVNAAGAVLFRSMVAGSGLTDDNNSGLWSDRGGSVQLVHRTGGQVPGMSAGVLFKELALQPVLTDEGRAVFWALLTGPGIDATNDAAIFSDLGGVTTPLLREGELISGHEPARIGTISRNPSVGADGSVVLMTSLVGDGVAASNNSSIALVTAGGGPTLLAREGSPAPRLPAGMVFTHFGEPVLMPDGSVAFTALVRNPASAFAESVLYVSTTSHGLVPLVREGEMIPVGDQTRTVKTITFENLRLPGAGVVGQSVLLRAGFTDGSAALLEARVGCFADFNHDGVLDPDDLSDFITCFFLDVLSPGACATADFNADGFRDPDDLSDFITMFFTGCG